MKTTDSIIANDPVTKKQYMYTVPREYGFLVREWKKHKQNIPEMCKLFDIPLVFSQMETEYVWNYEDKKHELPYYHHKRRF